MGDRSYCGEAPLALQSPINNPFKGWGRITCLLCSDLQWLISLSNSQLHQPVRPHWAPPITSLISPPSSSLLSWFSYPALFCFSYSIYSFLHTVQFTCLFCLTFSPPTIPSPRRVEFFGLFWSVMYPNHQAYNYEFKMWWRERKGKNARVDGRLEDLDTGTEIIKVSWPSIALYSIVGSNLSKFCCSCTPFSTFPHHTNPIPNLSLDMATLSLRLWSNLTPKMPRSILSHSGGLSQLTVQRQAPLCVCENDLFQ